MKNYGAIDIQLKYGKTDGENLPYIPEGKDFVVDGLSDMTFADQVGVGLQAEGLLNRPTRRIQVDRPGISQNKNAGYAKPYETVVDGIPVPPEEEITEEEYYSLLRKNRK